MPSFTSSSERGRFWRRGVAFWASLAGVTLALDGAVAARYDSDIERKYRALFDTAKRYDCLVLGTSHVAYGVDPRALSRAGASCYNFGYASATPTFYLPWYALYRRLRPAPATVVLGVDGTMLRETVASHRFAQDSEYFDPTAFWTALASPEADRTVLIANRFALVKERERYLSDLIGLGLWSYDLSRYADGFAPMTLRGELRPAASLPPIHPRQVAALDALLTRLAADGVHVVMVQTPEYRAPSVHDDDTRLYRRAAARHRLPFLDYNKALRSALNETPAHFMDWHHLSPAGAAAFSARLASDLAGRRAATPRPPAPAL